MRVKAAWNGGLDKDLTQLTIHAQLDCTPMKEQVEDLMGYISMYDSNAVQDIKPEDIGHKMAEDFVDRLTEIIEAEHETTCNASDSELISWLKIREQEVEKQRKLYESNKESWQHGYYSGIFEGYMEWLNYTKTGGFPFWLPRTKPDPRIAEAKLKEAINLNDTVVVTLTENGERVLFDCDYGMTFINNVYDRTSRELKTQAHIILSIFGKACSDWQLSNVFASMIWKKP